MPVGSQRQDEARDILALQRTGSASLKSLALLVLKHEGALPALRMVTAADGSARYVPASRATGRAAR